MKFQALGLPEALCVALEQEGITEPTAIQTGAIPTALAGRDLISSARTGSGKTLAYCLPMITRLSLDNKATALVLVPTREIGVQVQSVLAPYLRALKMPPATLIIGGVSFGPQIQNLRRDPAVIVATPGRLNDHLRGGKLRLSHVTTLVLDEADRMLDMGFLPQVRQILPHLNKERQTMLFSATMPSDLKQACRDMLRNPEQIAVDAPNVANVDIEQKMVEVTTAGKQDALLEAVKDQTESVLVFARTKRRTDRVAEYLDKYGVRAERIHGDRSQSQRQKAIDSFRSGKVKVLVATDIAARGLDIPLVELVINFDLPEAKEDYVHRIGRTGRAGEKGVALSFVTPEDRGHWASISGQKREGAGGGGGGSPRRQGSARPFGRGQRNDRPSDRPAARFERSDRQESSDRPQQEERDPRAPRPSRNQRWGAPRENKNRIFTGREGDSFGGERSSRGPSESRAPRNDRFQSRGPRTEDGPRFGGHGRSAPPATDKSRGRWNNRANQSQPAPAPSRSW